jgi:hypothetical protein
MKRSLTKSLKRRIAQSYSAIHENILKEHSRQLTDFSEAAVSITADKLKTYFKRAAFLLVGLFVLVCLCTILTSCNVTRTITNQSQYYQRGDTSVVIQTKTIETYDATKKL